MEHSTVVRILTRVSVAVLAGIAVVVIGWRATREARPGILRKSMTPSVPAWTPTAREQEAFRLHGGQQPESLQSGTFSPAALRAEGWRPIPGWNETGLVEECEVLPAERLIAALPAPVDDRPCKTFFGDGRCADPQPGDQDADGYGDSVDCNDHNAWIHPGAREVPCNNVDEDCDGRDYCPADRDEDGVPEDRDCDDNDPRRSPLRQEIRCNGVDENCDGYDLCDADGDGDDYPDDCDDRDPARNRSAREVMCDGIDQDCNGKDCCDNDEDGDGYPCKDDCDDRDPLTHPGADVPPGCYRKDRNCDGVVDGLCKS